MSLHRARAAAVAALVLFATACADDIPTEATASAQDAGPSAATVSTTHETIYRNGSGMDVNNYGVVVGYTHEDGWYRALLWSPTAGLDTLPAFTPGDHNRAIASAINDRGQIVGSALSENIYVPVLWSSSRSTPVKLASLVAGRHSSAEDINRDGMIVGVSDIQPGVQRAVVWTPNGTLLDIDAGGQMSSAVAVNDSGKVVGARKVSGRMRAYVWTQAGGFTMLPIGGDSSFAADINTRGDVAGTFWVGQQRRAFVWSPRTGLNDLGTFDQMWGAAHAINDAGTVVGEYVDHYGNHVGIVWNPRIGKRTLTGDGDWGRASALAINRQGHIAGQRTGSDGWPYLTRWTMTEVNTAPSVTLTASRLTAPEGDSIAFDTRFVDAENDRVSFTWTWGDGTSTTHPPFWSSILQNRTWNDQGTFPVRVIVSDPSGARDTANVTVTITNRAPTATFVVPAYTYEGRTYPLVISNLVEGAADKRAGVQAQWDCGFGFSAWSVSTRFTCPAVADDDTVTVAVRLRDKDGAQTEYTRQLVIYNAQPVVTVAAVTSTTVAAGTNFAARGSFSDAGAQDGPWLVRYYWGDGSYSSTTVNTRGTLPAMSHAYRAAGSYPVTVYVTDKDGRNGKSAALTVTVTQ